MGAKPGLPPKGHGVQRIAHPRVKQIAKQKKGTHRRVNEIDHRHTLGYAGHIPHDPVHITLGQIHEKQKK